jgi:hypothetical protein
VIYEKGSTDSLVVVHGTHDVPSLAIFELPWRSSGSGGCERKAALSPARPTPTERVCGSPPATLALHCVRELASRSSLLACAPTWVPSFFLVTYGLLLWGSLRSHSSRVVVWPCAVVCEVDCLDLLEIFYVHGPDCVCWTVCSLRFVVLSCTSRSRPTLEPHNMILEGPDPNILIE